MRGRQARQAEMLLGVRPDDLVPAKHPIRRIPELVDAILQELSPPFDAMYAERGRPSIPPEQLLKATLLMALSSVRCERQFCERLQYDLLFPWFSGFNITDSAFDRRPSATIGSGSCTTPWPRPFLGATVRQAQERKRISADHFTVDGTLPQDWASLKSFRPRNGQDPPAGRGRKLRYLGVARNQLWFLVGAASYNLIRIARLSAQAA